MKQAQNKQRRTRLDDFKTSELRTFNPDRDTPEEIAKINADADRLLQKYPIFCREDIIDRLLAIARVLKDLPWQKDHRKVVVNSWNEISKLKDFIGNLPEDYEIDIVLKSRTDKTVTFTIKDNYIVGEAITGISVGLEKIKAHLKPIREKGGQTGKRIDSILIRQYIVYAYTKDRPSFKNNVKTYRFIQDLLATVNVQLEENNIKQILKPRRTKQA